jgi:hypothetical protein
VWDIVGSLEDGSKDAYGLEDAAEPLQDGAERLEIGRSPGDGRSLAKRAVEAIRREVREAILEALKDIPDPISEEDNGNDDEGSAGTIGGEEVFECLLAFITVVERPKRQNSTKDAQQARQGVCP